MKSTNFYQYIMVTVTYRDSTGFKGYLTDVYGDEMKIGTDGDTTWYHLYSDGRLVSTFNGQYMKLVNKYTQEYHDEIAGDWTTFHMSYEFEKCYN